MEKQTYTVQEGDTIQSIALQFEMTLLSLLKNNGLSESSLIFPGMTLQVKSLKKEVKETIKEESIQEEKKIEQMELPTPSSTFIRECVYYCTGMGDILGLLTVTQALIMFDPHIMHYKLIKQDVSKFQLCIDLCDLVDVHIIERKAEDHIHQIQEESEDQIENEQENEQNDEQVIQLINQPQVEPQAEQNQNSKEENESQNVQNQKPEGDLNNLKDNKQEHDHEHELEQSQENTQDQETEGIKKEDKEIIIQLVLSNTKPNKLNRKQKEPVASVFFQIADLRQSQSPRSFEEIQQSAKYLEEILRQFIEQGRKYQPPQSLSTVPFYESFQTYTPLLPKPKQFYNEPHTATLQLKKKSYSMRDASIKERQVKLKSPKKRKKSDELTIDFEVLIQGTSQICTVQQIKQIIECLPRIYRFRT